MTQQLNTFLKDCEEMHINALTVSKKVLDGKDHVTLELASRKVMPDRMESPARAHVFHDANGFTDYLTRNKTDNLLVLIDTDNRIAQAVLDDRAEKGFELITFNPPHHPTFTLFEDNLHGVFDIKSFAQGVMMCRNLVLGVDGDEADAGLQLALLMKQITVSNEVTAEHGTGVECVNGVMVKTALRAGQAENKIKLPETIHLRTPIYLNTEPKVFELQITAVPRSATVVEIRTEAPELPVMQHELFEEMLVDVKGIDGALVTYGTIRTADWKYNR